MTITSRIIISVVWLLFFAIFFSLYYQHSDEAKRSIPDIPMKRQIIMGQLTPSFVDLDKPLLDFVRDFNIYLKNYNESSSRANERAAEGYFVAAWTALFSIVTTWWDNIRKLFSQCRNKFVKCWKSC
jgi:hypothetical protein